jgi:non-specific serine/threonine protein kinase
LGSKGGILQALSNIGHVVYMQGDLEEARAIFVEALTLAHEMDARKIAAEVLTGMSSVIMAEARGDRGTETPLPRGLISGEAPVPPGEGITKAVKILGITSAIVERSGRQLEPIDQEEFDRNLASARAALGEQAFDIAWEEGRGMNIEQAIDLAGRSIADAQPPVGKSTTRYPGGLTRREAEVTALVARGLTNEAIAHQLVLSERTIEMHVSHALHRLGLTTRTQLTAWAMHGNLAPGTTED